MKSELHPFCDPWCAVERLRSVGLFVYLVCCEWGKLLAVVVMACDCHSVPSCVILFLTTRHASSMAVAPQYTCCVSLPFLILCKIANLPVSVCQFGISVVFC